jgi:hypothetical protein
MTTFLVEAYMPVETDLDEVRRRVSEAAGAMADEGGAIRYVRSVFVPSDETCFHFVEGNSEHDVAELIRRASLAFTRIAEARP